MHDRRSPAQIGKIDVALLVACHDDNLHPCHLRRGRVSAVSRRRDQADIAMAFVAALVIVTDRQQPGVFALRAGVWLHTQRIVAGQLNQPFGELGDHLMIPFRLIHRAERMKLSKLRPGNRDHFRRRIELHGAGTERDHRLV